MNDSVDSHDVEGDAAMRSADRYCFTPIGTIHSPFKEKFGIPRQPGLMPSAEARLELLPPYDRDEALRGLEAFSHLWIVFVFHGIDREEWRPTVRPPRLGGNERVGVFATRSTHRPNPIGLSVVELTRIVRESGRLFLELRNVDLMDGTPILDIKPYVAYADSIPEAHCGFAPDAPSAVVVNFSAQAEQRCAELARRYPHLRHFIGEMLRLDPRPSYQSSAGRRYGVHIYDLNVVWHFEGEVLWVDDIEPVKG
jgi:tRNA-Thr(GGU) m(6)t(6)A37 methyltransferase TsaA